MSLRRSLTWTYAAQIFSVVLTFASTIVVARLVSPRDFGIFAMANALTTIINVFLQFGLGKYIMREAEVSRDLLRSVFTINCLLTFVYVALILAGALTAGPLFGSPEVGKFLLVFALSPLIAMFEFIPSTLAARAMRFGLISAMAVLRAVVLAAVTILLALQRAEYMSFAWAQVAAWLATCLLFNLVVWRPDVWKPRLTGARDILRFGFDMVGIAGAAQLNNRGGEMILGSLQGLAPLGLYTRASSLPTSLTSTLFTAGSNVVFSRLSDDLRTRGTIHETYLRFMRMIIGLMWPSLVGIAILAQPLILTLYGAKWQPAANPLALLAIAAAAVIGIGMTTEVFVLREENRKQVKIEGVRAVLGLALFAAGSSISLTVAAAARLLEAVGALLFYFSPMKRLLQAPKGALRRLYVEAIILTAVACGPSLALMVAYDFSPQTPLLAICGAVLLGALLWAALLFSRGHPLGDEALRLLRSRRAAAAEAS